MELVMSRQLGDTFEQEKEKIFRFIRSRVATAEDAEDILQDVYMKAAEYMDATEPIHNLLGWLYTAARNRITDWYRSRKRAESPVSQLGEDLSVEDLIETSGIPAEDDFLKQEILEALMDAIEDLPEPQRAVVIAQAVEGKSFRELAEETGESINTLLARKRYAVQTLKKRLKEMKALLDELTTGGR